MRLCGIVFFGKNFFSLTSLFVSHYRQEIKKESEKKQGKV
jgi:hypothetical protein